MFCVSRPCQVRTFRVRMHRRVLPSDWPIPRVPFDPISLVMAWPADLFWISTISLIPTTYYEINWAKSPWVLHTDFIYHVLSATTNSSGIPTKNATNTLYPSMPEASKLGLGLGLRVYHVLVGYNPSQRHLDSLHSTKRKDNQLNDAPKNKHGVHFCNPLRAKTTLFRFMLSESDPMPFPPKLDTYTYTWKLRSSRTQCIFATLSSPDSCARFLFLRVVYPTPNLRD